MVEAFERRDLPLAPESGVWGWLWFGDGYDAMITSMLPGKNQEGMDIWKLTIVPTEQLARRYNITTDMLDENLAINIDLPYDSIKQLSHDPAQIRYFCFLNFKGQKCPETETWQGKINADIIESFRKKIEILNAKTAALTERLWKAEGMNMAWIRENLAQPQQQLNQSYIQPQPIQNVPPTRNE